MSENTVEGTTKWFNTEKGFGFLQLPGGGLDIFIHANQLRKSGVTRSLVEGERVRFCVNQGPKGSFATDIEIVGDKNAG